MGFTNYVDRIPLTFDEFREPKPRARPGVALIAQSGGLVGAIRDSLVGSGVSVTYSISTGNESVVTAEDFLDPILDDAATGTILIFAEQIRRPQKMLRLAAIARERGKPIVLMQTGRTAEARQAAQSHTGAMTGDVAVMRAMLSGEGVAVLDNFDALIDVAAILNRYPVPSLPGASVLTNSGAMRGVAFDIAAQVGLKLVEFSPETTAALRAIVPSYMPVDNPFDIATLTFRQPELWGPATGIVLDEPRAGVFIMTLFPGSLVQQKSRMDFLQPVLASSQKPVALAMLGEPMPLDESFVARCREEGIPLLRSTERAMRAMAAVVEVGRNLQRKKYAAKKTAPIPAAKEGTIPEYRSKELLAAAGIAAPKGQLAADLAAAEKIAAAIGYPVVLKAQSAALSHKSDAGGVIAGIADEVALASAWDKMQRSVARARPGLKLDGILVEAMAEPGLEMIVGARRDPDWGVVLMLGVGGIWVETLRDVQILAGSAGEDEILEALDKLRAAPLLRGTRGSPTVDREAIARTLRTLGDLVEASPAVTEIEINPLLAHAEGEGALALDALIVTKTM
jgi:acyl-CoA synthetase (NDP forming)